MKTPRILDIVSLTKIRISSAFAQTTPNMLSRPFCRLRETGPLLRELILNEDGPLLIGASLQNKKRRGGGGNGGISSCFLSEMKLNLTNLTIPGSFLEPLDRSLSHFAVFTAQVDKTFTD